ncbi:hypothetical protein NLI96_g5822 [Meripilus lineatus]|uniref:Uncharacterized protein n=1 Tax=Meripilus lineatus TaxID=2056292 RepID=A0AAD5V291_9APHY|nr:hypothetical protein NLI96_g5822 [Physisporinus lineatus]
MTLSDSGNILRRYTRNSTNPGEEVENCYVETRRALCVLKVEEKDATIQTLRAQLDQANNDLGVAKEAHSLEITTLTGQLAQKDNSEAKIGKKARNFKMILHGDMINFP